MRDAFVVQADEMTKLSQPSGCEDGKNARQASSDQGLIIYGSTGIRHNFFFCQKHVSGLSIFINKFTNELNLIYELSNDVNFINEKKAKKIGNESLAFDFFLVVSSLSSSLL